MPWFPRDNDVDLLKESCREAGKPRRVYFGAPAGGAGIHGCAEMGSSVLALCYDEHRRTRLGKFLAGRAVEAMLGTTAMVFGNDALVARSVQLRLTKAGTATGQDDKKEDKNEDKKDDKQANNTDNKRGSNNADDEAGSKKGSKTADDDPDSDSDSDGDSEPEPDPPEKKAKKAKEVS